MNMRGVGSWLPDRPATWTDVTVVVLGVLLIGTNLVNTESVAWAWVSIGSLATLLAVGPIANTKVGIRIGTWFRTIGVGGRAIFIVGWAVLIAVVYATVSVPGDATIGFFIGVMVGAIVYGLAHIVYSGGIQGWQTQRDT
jgi:hypothetical protein